MTNQNPIIDCVILAGGKMESSLIPHSDAPSKGYIEIAGKPMMAYVISAVEKVKRIRRIVLAGDESLVPGFLKDKLFAIAPPGNSMMESLRSAVCALDPPPDRVLILPCDLVLLTPESVDDFIDKSLDPPADITYGYLSKEDSQAEFPDVNHTYVKIQEGTFCGTGFFLMNPALIDTFEDLFNRLAANRKNPLALAGVLGFGMIFQLLFGTMTVKDAESRVMELMGGCVARGIRTRHAKAGFNVDAPNELMIAKRILEGVEAAG